MVKAKLKLKTKEDEDCVKVEGTACVKGERVNYKRVVNTLPQLDQDNVCQSTLQFNRTVSSAELTAEQLTVV